MGIIDLLKDVPLSAVLKEKITALETENKSLKSENSVLNGKLAQSEEQRRALEKQIVEINHKQPHQFDEETGTWIDTSTSIRYCPSCKAKGINAALIKHDDYWRCSLKECRLTYDFPHSR